MKSFCLTVLLGLVLVALGCSDAEDQSSDYQPPTPKASSSKKSKPLADLRNAFTDANQWWEKQFGAADDEFDGSRSDYESTWKEVDQYNSAISQDDTERVWDEARSGYPSDSPEWQEARSGYPQGHPAWENARDGWNDSRGDFENQVDNGELDDGAEDMAKTFKATRFRLE